MLEAALEAGLSSAGVDTVLTGPLPTPAIAYLTVPPPAGRVGDFGVAQPCSPTTASSFQWRWRQAFRRGGRGIEAEIDPGPALRAIG